ncbi:MAG TPA: epoxyqueuosine reductase, partial [bacterium]|nr:epoxyqueuosine reductase [bacterium]
MHLAELTDAIGTVLQQKNTCDVPGLGSVGIYDAPLVGVAAGDDPLFAQLRNERVIGPKHRSPQE